MTWVGIGHVPDRVAHGQGEGIDVGELHVREAAIELLLCAAAMQEETQLAVRGLLAHGQNVHGIVTLGQWHSIHCQKQWGAGIML